jgi:hypothetical protein
MDIDDKPLDLGVPYFQKKNTKTSCTLLGKKSGFQSLALGFHQNHGADHPLEGSWLNRAPYLVESTPGLRI